MTALLSSTYFGPVQWYQKLARYDEVSIEDCDNYQKQTYRNRCIIAAANGPQALTVPVVVPEEGMPDARRGNRVRIVYPTAIGQGGPFSWRHQHWQALQSAYGDSPFFEFYEDDLRPFFTEQWEFLYELNEAIRQKMCQLLDIQPKVSLTQTFVREAQHDFRQAIRPKHAADDADFVAKRYYQVYERRHGFLPNLSVLDLLLNMGPESIFYL